MTESISSSGNVSLSVLSDIKSFLRSGASKSESTDNTEEKNKTAESAKRDVSRKALSNLLEKSYNSNLKTVQRNAEENVQNDASTTNPLKVNTPEKEAQAALSIRRPEADPEQNSLRVNTPDRDSQSALSIRRPEADPEQNSLRVNTPDRDSQSALSIRRPEAKAETDPLKVNVQSTSDESALKINTQEKETEKKSATSTLPKQKNAILYELRNSMRLNYSAWDIAKKYGISYMQAQEIYVDLNQDSNGVVKEFNLPENSTVSYLV